MRIWYVHYHGNSQEELYSQLQVASGSQTTKRQQSGGESSSINQQPLATSFSHLHSLQALHPTCTFSRCEFDLLFYNSQSQANWSRKNGRALPAVRGEISNTEI